MSSDGRPSAGETTECSMGQPARAAPNAWTDKFTPPTIEGLLADLGDHRSTVDEARALLLNDSQVREDVSWEGVAWRWSAVYTREGDATRAWAYLVPDPDCPRICVPLPSPAVQQIRQRRVKKGVRDAIAQAPTIDGVAWVTLALAAVSRPGSGLSAASLEEVAELLRVKRDALDPNSGDHPPSQPNHA